MATEHSSPMRYYAGIIPFDGDKPTGSFDFPQSRMRYVWTPDSRSLIYIMTRAGVSNLWSQPIGGGKPAQITDFTSDQIFWFDYSRDHHQLACARGTQTADVVLINDLKCWLVTNPNVGHVYQYLAPSPQETCRQDTRSL